VGAAARITVPRRFNGPLQSGNGGYGSGLIAALLGGLAEVSLRSPIPLDTPLDLVPGEEGTTRVLHGEVLIAEARPTTGVDLEVPAAVAVDDARRGAERYRGLHDGPFCKCFVCGLERRREECFEVFAGKVAGREMVASPWTPPPWSAGPDGDVLPEFVWAVLDCPTYFACYLHEEPALAMLVSQSAQVHAPVAAGEEHVVASWPIARDGRKLSAGAALFSAAGETLASCRALLIEPRAMPAGAA